jgi:hypothetical protein
MEIVDGIKVISAESLLAARRKGEHVERLPYRVNGEMREVEVNLVKGEMQVDLPSELFDMAMGELLKTPSGLDAIVQKTVIDIEVGREQVPLLYTPIYRRRENRAFPKNIEVGPAFGRARVVFVEHIEGEEVKFGTRTLGARDTVPIITYAAGFQWTEDMEEYDATWEAEETSRAFGEAYNALLNHLHLNPVITYAYAAKNKTAYAVTGNTFEKDRLTIKTAIEHAAQDKHPDTNRVRRPTVVLAHPSNQFRVMEALQRAQIGGTVYEAIGQQLTTVILYDGWSDTVGEKTYTYAGCPTNKIYLIDPSRYFQELVKHDLLVDADNADISKLIKEQVVARARRGVYSAPANAVEEVTFA